MKKKEFDGYIHTLDALENLVWSCDDISYKVTKTHINRLHKIKELLYSVFDGKSIPKYWEKEQE